MAYVATVGQILKAELPEKASPYWKARVTTVRKRLAGEGWGEEAIEAEVAAFTEAVRAEAGRRRGAA